jgi:hypothetical protein
MLQLTPQSTIFVANKPVDFRKGIDGLAAVCRQFLKLNPFDGAFFLFYNKRANAIKILVYDGQGFWLCLKRLSRGKFTSKPNFGALHPASKICFRSFLILINNGNPFTANIPKDWRSPYSK